MLSLLDKTTLSEALEHAELGFEWLAIELLLTNGWGVHLQPTRPFTHTSVRILRPDRPVVLAAIAESPQQAIIEAISRKIK